MTATGYDDPALEVIPDLMPAPSEEDWGVLIGGHASDWLRAQFLRTCQEDPDAADRLALLTDPAYRAAMDEAGALVRAPVPVATILRADPAPAQAMRQVELRLRPNRTYLYGGIAAMLAGYIAGSALLPIGLVTGVALLVCFAMDQHNTHPRVQAKKARDAGDTGLAEAIEEALNARDLGASGEKRRLSGQK